MGLTLLIIVIVTALGFLFLNNKRKQQSINHIQAGAFSPLWEAVLVHKVAFFRQLSEEYKALFRKRVQLFISQTPINGVETQIDDELKVLVACSAIIPVFYFKNWDYSNLSEVLVYPNMIDSYQIENTNQVNTIVGQVHPFQNRHIVLLSKPQLIQGFLSINDKHNVGFHEFVHLIDNADGDTDGIPKELLTADLIKPWSELMYKEIEQIKAEKSDIDPYGITNHAEFFAVVCEYFFEDSDRFHKNHPELYQLLSKAFIGKN